jgi:hypothetical protein
MNVVGFNGIAVTGWVGGFLNLMPSRFRDGRISVGIMGQFRRRVED